MQSPLARRAPNEGWLGGNTGADVAAPRSLYLDRILASLPRAPRDPRVKGLVPGSKRSGFLSMLEGAGRYVGRTLCMGLVQGQVDDVSMTYPSFGNDVIGKMLHIGATSLEHCNFHATLLIEMHVQRRLRQVAMIVEIAREALRQFARSMVVNIDQSRHTRMGSADLYGCLLEARAGEVADRL
jgi:hypothetical protein